MWCDIDVRTPYDWSNKFYGFYVADAVNIVSGHECLYACLHVCVCVSAPKAINN